VAYCLRNTENQVALVHIELEREIISDSKICVPMPNTIDQPHRIGIDLGGTKIEGASFSNTGQVLARRRVPSPQDDYGQSLAAIKSLIDYLEGNTGPAISLGIGMPGTLSPETKLVKNSNSTWLNGMPMATDLERLLGRPVKFENDANCFALSEAVDGAGKYSRLVFGVIIGTGTGGGLIFDKGIWSGKNAIGGEWGHNPLPWPSRQEQPGPLCYCGRRGCLETFLSGPGLSADHYHATGRRLAPDELAESAMNGDQDAELTLTRYEDRLARGLASLMNVIDPEVIVLGGGLSHLNRLYKNVPLLWDRYVFSDHVTTQLLPPTHGASSGVRGAAWLWDTK